MVVKCNDIVIAIVIIEQGGIRSGISDAPVDMEHDNNRDHRGISVSLHITPTYSHNHIFRTYSHTMELTSLFTTESRSTRPSPAAAYPLRGFLA